MNHSTVKAILRSYITDIDVLNAATEAIMAHIKVEALGEVRRCFKVGCVYRDKSGICISPSMECP